MIFIGIYTSIIIYVEYEWWHWDLDPFVKNLTTVQTLLGFVLSLLLVFRTNTAYDRWWEGRKLWGALTNNARTLSIKLNAILDKSDLENRKYFSKGIALYAHSLKQHLRSADLEMELDEGFHGVDVQHHIPNQISSLLTQRIYHLEKEGKITSTHLLSIQNEISEFQNICGGCERIRNTPIPFSYSLFIKKFIFIYVVTMPLAFVPLFGYLSAFISTFVFYALVSMELLAEEIEDPFGSDENDLPTDQLCITIQNNCLQIFGA